MTTQVPQRQFAGTFYGEKIDTNTPKEKLLEIIEFLAKDIEKQRERHSKDIHFLCSI